MALRLDALDVQGLGLGHLDAVHLAPLHSGCADVLAGTAQILQVHRGLPLHDAVAPVGVAADELGGGFLAGHAGGVLEIHVVGLVHRKARDLTHCAGLHQLLGQIALLDEAVVLHEDFQILGADDHPAASLRHAVAAQGTLCGQSFLVGGGSGAGGLGGADVGTRCALQRLDGLFVDGQSHGVACAVQTLGGDAVGHGCSVKAVDDLVHGLVVVDVQIQIGGGAGIGIHAVCLVVGLDGNLSVADRDLDLTGLGAALVAVVEDGIVAGDQSRTQLCIYQSGITLLTCMCHRNLLSLLQVQFRVQGFESGFHTIAVVGGRCTVLGSGGDHGHTSCTVLTKGPRIRLGSIVQCLCNVGTAVGRAFQGIQIQQSTHCLDAAALLAHDGGIQGIIEGKALGLRLHVGLQLGDLLLQACHVHAVKGFQAVLCGLELGVCVVQLGLQGRGGRLLPVDVCAVLLHDPVQLFIGDAGDLVLHVFTLHGGNSFRV
nr:MAG TPA: hypothetical protein [Caudoviricetes sp.]